MNDAWVYLRSIALCAAVIIIFLFLGMGVADLGFEFFNYPSFPFADGVGMLCVLAGMVIVISGLVAAVKLWRFLTGRRKSNETTA